jgi:hypothetical protein
VLDELSIEKKSLFSFVSFFSLSVLRKKLIKVNKTKRMPPPQLYICKSKQREDSEEEVEVEKKKKKTSLTSLSFFALSERKKKKKQIAIRSSSARSGFLNPLLPFLFPSARLFRFVR